jgi:hypothetical protein
MNASASAARMHSRHRRIQAAGVLVFTALIIGALVLVTFQSRIAVNEDGSHLRAAIKLTPVRTTQVAPSVIVIGPVLQFTDERSEPLTALFETLKLSRGVRLRSAGRSPPAA